MVWRALETRRNGELVRIGAVSFLVSDTILSLTELTQMIPTTVVSVPLANLLVLSTYYFSQFCFTKSAL